MAEDLQKAEEFYEIGIARGDDFAVKQLSHLGYVFEEMARDIQTPGAYDPLTQQQYGSFRKLGVPYFGVLIIRILLFRVLY